MSSLPQLFEQTRLVFEDGRRLLRQTGLGGVPEPEIEDNTDAWIGDHCMDPAAAPGVLFTRAPMRLGHPRLQDVTGPAAASICRT